MDLFVVPVWFATYYRYWKSASNVISSNYSEVLLLGFLISRQMRLRDTGARITKQGYIMTSAAEWPDEEIPDEFFCTFLKLSGDTIDLKIP